MRSALDASVCAGFVLCSLAARAHAQTASCDDTSVQGAAPLEVIPGDGATSVARDAAVIVRYARDADLDGLLQKLARAPGSDACARSLVCLFEATGTAAGGHVPVAGALQRLDAHSAAFVPAQPLAPRSSFVAAVARPGFDNAARSDVAFKTGADVDREAPRFDPSPDEIDLELDSPPSECAAPPGSLRVRLAMPRARDDADEQSVRILLYLTRARGLDAPLLRARVPNPDEGRVQLRFLLTPEQARAPLCLAPRAIDGAGKLASGEPEVCFDPARSSHFAGCGIAHAGARGRCATMAARARILLPWCAVFAFCRRRLERRRLDAGAPGTRIA